MSELIPKEWIITLVVFSFIFFFLGSRKVAISGFLLVGALTIVPMLKSGVSSIVPWWLSVLLGLIGVAIALKLLLAITMGRNVADQAIGQLIASFIKTLIKAPFRFIKYVGLARIFVYLLGKLNRSTQDTFKKAKGFSVTNLLGDIDKTTSITNECFYSPDDIVTGKIIEKNERGCIINIGNGYRGILDFDCKQQADIENSWQKNVFIGTHLRGTVKKVRHNERIIYVQFIDLESVR